MCLELGMLADLIVKDFVLYWYEESISPDPQFPNDVRDVLQSVLGKLGDRILRVNLPMFLLCDISYVLRHHLQWFSELRESANSKTDFEHLSRVDKNAVILEEFATAGHLHPACGLSGESNDPRSIAYIRRIMSEILVRLLPEQDFHCSALRHLLREVLTCSVLAPLLESITPDVLNAAILQFLVPSDINCESHETAAEKHQKQQEMEFAERKESNYSDTLEEELENEKGISSTFVENASIDMQKGEASRFLVDLMTAVDQCIIESRKTSPLTFASQAVRQLLSSVDAILRHGNKIQGGLNEPWWNYVRNSVKSSHEAAMSVNLIDPTVTLFNWAAHDATEEIEEQKSKLELNKLSQKFQASKSALLKSFVFKRYRSRTSSNEEQEKLLDPGKVWLSMMLKNRILEDVIAALTADTRWTDTHYMSEAAIRMPQVLQSLELLKPLSFEFDLTPFWAFAQSMRKDMESHGEKLSTNEKLRRTRKKITDRIKYSLAIKKGAPPECVKENTFIALTPRVGSIRTKIKSYKMKLERKIRSTTFVQYKIECDLTRESDGGISSWIIFRRYSSFLDLHNDLSSKLGHKLDDIHLPKKGGVFNSATNEFIIARQQKLDEYLRELVKHPAVHEFEDDILAFLSPQTIEDFTNIDEDADEEAELFEPDKRDYSSSVLDDDPDEDQYSKHPIRGTSITQGPTIDPYDLRIAEGHLFQLAQEVFEFHELSFMRRNLISVMRGIVSLAFNGAAHKWLKDNYTRKASAGLLARMLSGVRELLWPDGAWAEGDEEVVPMDKEQELLNASLCLKEMISAVPMSLRKFLGKEKSQTCCNKLHEFLQHPSLIHNLVFTIMDLLVMRIFPDLPMTDIHKRHVSHFHKIAISKRGDN